MYRPYDFADPHYYLWGFVFWDTVVNGLRTGTAVASNARLNLWMPDDSVGGAGTYRLMENLGPGTLVEVKAVVSEAFNAGGQAMVLGRNGTTAQISTWGTDALLQPAAIGVKETTTLLAANLNSFFTGQVIPEARLTYTGAAPTAGVVRFLFKILQ